MPPLVATAERVKPIAPAARKQQGVDFDNDGWLEKVHAAQEHHADLENVQPHKCNIIQRTLTGLSLNKHHRRRTKALRSPQSYREELQTYIAESNATLRAQEEEEPQSSSDDDDSNDDELCCPRNAEIIDFSESIVSLDSVQLDAYVEPPVEVPSSYRKQDRQGGVLVAGSFVTFTNWAFKRQLRHLGRLGPIPERGEAQLPAMLHEADVSKGLYSGKIVEL